MADNTNHLGVSLIKLEQLPLVMIYRCSMVMKKN